jgi:uncharacterized membrane protein
MSALYLGLEVVFLLSAPALFGTRLGTVFRMWLAHRSSEVGTNAHAARNIVIADLLLQPPPSSFGP